MTDKQKDFLKKYLNDNNLKKLEKMNFKCVSSFIDMIIQNRWFHPVYGEMCSVPKFEMKPSKQEQEYIKNIEQIVNANKKEFGLLTDEYAYVDNILYFDDEHKWYQLKQEWFKGMSNSPTTRTALVKYYHSSIKHCSTCSEFDGIYNELFDMGVYSMSDLIKFFFKKATRRDQDGESKM